MDPYVLVRFHFGGTFARIAGKLGYFGEKIAMACIQRDRMSLSEIRLQLQHHCPVDKVAMLYWREPGKSLDDGSTAIVDDNVCLLMASYHTKLEICDIYVEHILDEIPDEKDDTERRLFKKLERIILYGGDGSSGSKKKSIKNKKTCKKRSGQDSDEATDVQLENDEVIDGEGATGAGAEGGDDYGPPEGDEGKWVWGCAKRKRRESKQPKEMTWAEAVGDLETSAGGTGEIKLEARLPMAEAGSSVTINVTSGKGNAAVEASLKASAQKRLKGGKQQKTTMGDPVMPLPPSEVLPRNG